MKLPNMALIFAIIIIPITLVFSMYVRYQISTVSTQTTYDTRLFSATRDAITALEMNTFGDATTDLASSTRRNVLASVNAFTNSFASNFNITGYNKSDVLTYVPALLFTMYDGYYIYAPTTENKTEDGFNDHVLKPYVYYSARYKGKGTNHKDFDVVINYSLDNYITITGIVNDNEYVSKSGYLIDTSKYNASNNTYDNVTLKDEKLYETMSFYEEDYNMDGYINYTDRDMFNPSDSNYQKVVQILTNNAQPTKVTLKCQYGYKNNQKYYFCVGVVEPTTISSMSYINNWYTYDNTGHAVKVNPDTIGLGIDILNDKSAQKFYKEAYEFTNWVKGLDDTQQFKGVTITPNDMIKPDGTPVNSLDDKSDIYYIFKEDTTNVLNADGNASSFIQHKLNVMQASIIYNLNVAISNYAGSSGMSDIAMPEISENEWNKILTNISMVSFVQGMPIGFKTYNNYAIVTSTNNPMYVGDNSIYYVVNSDTETTSKEHHMANCSKLSSASGNITGYPSTEFDMYTINYQTSYSTEPGNEQVYDHYLSFYRHQSLDCYECIVNKSSKAENPNLKQARILATARIKYNQYKATQYVNNKAY